MAEKFTIAEIKRLINESSQKKLFPYEQSDANKQLFKEYEVGFEAVLTENGSEKILLPEDGTVTYLYRGQNKEYIPCYPSLYRKSPKPLSDSEIFTWRMRFTLFCDMLDSYPTVEKFFKRHEFKIDYEGLAQHYGLLTSVLDLTSNLDIALFFATCWYDKDNDCYRPFEDGKEHEGILYIFDPLRANEPIPSIDEYFMKGNITPIGLQPFLRPAKQKGYALHIKKGKSTKSWGYRFKFTNEESLEYYNLFNGGKDLWIDDILAEKTKMICRVRTFSFKLFERTYEKFRPKGYSRNKLKTALKGDGISLVKITEPLLFSKEEKEEAVRKWNEGEGKLFCDTIGRRRWYKKIGPDEKGRERADMKSVVYYRTLKMLGTLEMLRFIAHFEGPDKAEWINYMNTPDETHRYKLKNKEECYPGIFVDSFTQKYLKEDDYIIR